MNKLNLTIINNITELSKVLAQTEAFAQKHNIPQKAITNINIALDELITNTISYSYTDEAEHVIKIEVTISDPNTLTVVLTDDGKAFNPIEEAPVPDLDSDIEDRRIGGLGIHIIKKTMSQFLYQRKDDKNIITLVKKY